MAEAPSRERFASGMSDTLIEVRTSKQAKTEVRDLDFLIFGLGMAEQGG